MDGLGPGTKSAYVGGSPQWELMHDTLDAWTEYVHGRIDEFGQEE